MVLLGRIKFASVPVLVQSLYLFASVNYICVKCECLEFHVRVHVRVHGRVRLRLRAGERVHARVYIFVFVFCFCGCSCVLYVHGVCLTRLPRSILSGDTNMETGMETNLPTANKHFNSKNTKLLD